MKFLSPSDVVALLAADGVTVSERELRRKARELGTYRQIGKAMFFTEDDFSAFLEGCKPQQPAHPTGGYQALLKLKSRQKAEREREAKEGKRKAR